MTFSNFDVRAKARFTLPPERVQFLKELEESVKAERRLKASEKRRQRNAPAKPVEC